MNKPTEKNQKLLIDLAKLFDDNGVKYKSNTSHEMIMDSCYNCGRAKKLYVSQETGAFICFRCNEKGNAVKLVAKYLNISFKEASKLLFGKDSEKTYSSIKAVEDEDDSEPFILSLGGLSKKKSNSDLELPQEIKLAPEFVLLTEDFSAPWNYLIKRGYTKQDILQLKLLILPFESFNEAWKAIETRLKNEGLSGDALKDGVKSIVRYHERIVFPVYIDNKIMGFVARDYTGQKEPKVLNSTGNFRSFSVWNYDNAKNSENLIICEGNTSAVKCGVSQSIALLGKVATPGQIRLIRKMKAKKIFFCLDVGTTAEQLTLYKTFAPFYPGKIYTIELPPVIQIKNSKFTKEIVDFINKDFSLSMDLLNPTLLEADPNVKSIIYNICRINSKLDKDIKKKLLLKYTHNKNYTESQKEFLFWLLFDSEYKDSGDYTQDEMADFIKKANIMQGGLNI